MEYHLHIEQPSELRDGKSGTYRKYKMLDLLMLILPLQVSRSPSSRNRRKYITPSVALLFWILNMADIIYFGYRDMTASTDLIDWIISGILYSLWALSKTFSMYYFYFHFNYPWHHIPDPKEESHYKLVNYYMSLLSLSCWFK